MALGHYVKMSCCRDSGPAVLDLQKAMTEYQPGDVTLAYHLLSTTGTDTIMSEHLS